MGFGNEITHRTGPTKSPRPNRGHGDRGIDA
jgi:hypothetical protein